MAPLDLILLIVFSALTALGLSAAVYSVHAGMRAARRRDGELTMVAWAAGALIGLTVAGMSAAYILLPIIFGI